VRKVLACLALPAFIAGMLFAGGAAAGGGGVARYQIQSAVLTVSLEPAGFQGNIHVYDITINPCDGSFTGVSNPADVIASGETIHAVLNGANIDFTADYNVPLDYYEWYGTGPLATIAGSDNQGASWSPLLGSVAYGPNLTSYKNHGDFVSSSPDKNDAAHACIGMPVNSNK